MYLEIVKDFFGNPVVKYFLFFSLFCYIAFLCLSFFSDIDYHKKNKKKIKNAEKLMSQKQQTVSESEI
tara:strand:+ start:515 stop:718 length:204 start_codon:yes stop_codon:yes gene_type:complete